MRVLVISQRVPTRHHPAQPPDNCLLFDELARRHEVRVVRPVGMHRVLKAVVGGWRGDRLRSAETPDVVCPVYPAPAAAWNLKGARRYDVSVRAAARATARDFRPHVILASWAYPESWTAVRLARELDVPVVLKCYAVDGPGCLHSAAMQEALDVVRTADAVIAADRASARAVVLRGVPERLVRIVPDGVARPRAPRRTTLDARKFLSLAEGDHVVVCIGDARVTKGAADLVRACAILKQRGMALRCCLVGDGLASRALTRLVRSRGLEDQVLFASGASELDCSVWLDACDVVVYPGYSDHMLHVLREAIEHQKPFVATRVGGVSDIGDPAGCRLVLAGDIGSLANAMRDLLQKPPTMTADLANRINLSWEDSASLVTECLTQAVKRRLTMRERRRRRDALKTTRGARGATRQRLDSGADVDTLRRLAATKRRR